MSLVAYIRVSSIGQSLEVQRDKMLALGVEPDHIFEEKRSGVDSNRPAELKDAGWMPEFLRRGVASSAVGRWLPGAVVGI